MSAEAHRPSTTHKPLSFPLGGTIYTTSLKKPAEYNLPAIGADMSGVLGTEWEDSKIIDLSGIPADGQKDVTYIHARIPAVADQYPNQWEFSTCSIGGKQFDSVAVTIITQSPQTTSENIGAALPGTVPVSGSYVLADVATMNSGMQLEPVFRVERRNYVLRTTRRMIGVDSLNGKALWSSTSLYCAGESVSGIEVAALFAAPTDNYWGLQSDGTKRSGQQLSSKWYSITTENVIAGTFSGSELAIDSFEADENYYWPAVLSQLEFMDWARRDGGVDIYPRSVFSRDAYSGPCNATVTRTWRKTPWVNLNVEKLIPTPIYYASPFFSLSVPPCLHPEVKPKCDIGSGDPYYSVNSGSVRTIEPSKLGSTSGGTSDCTTWPSTIRAYDGQVPFRGGYLRTVKIISKPG